MIEVPAIGAPQNGESEDVVTWYRRREFERKHRKSIAYLTTMLGITLRDFHNTCDLATLQRA